MQKPQVGVHVSDTYLVIPNVNLYIVVFKPDGVSLWNLIVCASELK